jgi:two-component sensor histidine kinase
MSVLDFYTTVINSGLQQEQTGDIFAAKVKNRNKLASICILFSFIYFIFFLNEKLFLPFSAISLAIFLFGTSIYLNYARRYKLSGLILIITTNFCVMFFSLYLGLSSGIHLYLLTSPLIVLAAFDSTKVKTIYIAMSTYILNYLVIIIGSHYLKSEPVDFPSGTVSLFYTLNFSCSILILIILSLFFFNSNKTTYKLLREKNEELALENITRKEAEIKAKEALAERELLLSEIHHRVKNNLAVVSSLLEVHTITVQDPGILKVIKQCQNRIKSIAILHEKLYSNKSLKEINIKEYLSQLIEYIDKTFSATDKEIKFKINIQNISLEMSQAMPFGLLLNELITNSYKHAFRNNTVGIISIDFVKQGKNYELTYNDNGAGFVYVNNPERKSLGLTLIETFSQQLHGEASFTTTSRGMNFYLKF